MSAPEERYKNVLAILNRIAEACERMEKNMLTLTEKMSLQDSRNDNIIYHMDNASGILTPGEEILDALREGIADLPPGESRLLPDGRWLHRCKECLYIWISDLRNPRKCQNRGKDEVTDTFICQTVQWYKGSGEPKKYGKRKKKPDNTT